MRIFAITAGLATLAATLASAWAATRAAPAPPTASPASVHAAAPIVVELFTSQGCSSCPPAEALLRDLATRDDLIALEWHVDYWDDLRHGAAGTWKDPFSSAANTARQREYNSSLRGTGAVYTPQVVISGAYETVGSDRKRIEALLKDAATVSTQTRISADVSHAPGDEIHFTISKAAADAELLLVTFRTEATTTVTHGENHGRKLASAHIVTDAKRLSPADVITILRPADGQGCALLAQEKDVGRVLAGAYCPG